MILLVIMMAVEGVQEEELLFTTQQKHLTEQYKLLVVPHLMLVQEKTAQISLSAT